MKKFLLSTAALLAMGSAFAQNRTASHTGRASVENASLIVANDAANKTTATDTIQGALNFPAAYLDSLVLYRADAPVYDSGFVVGMNAYGDRGFAERFDFRTGDTTVRVIGVFTLFGGTYTQSTTKTINLRVWNQGARTTVFTGRPKLLYSGFPATALATQAASIKNLGINLGTGNDSIKRTNFATVMTPLSDTFFVGFDVNYSPTSLGGDTVGLYSTFDGDRFAPVTYMQGTDTIVNVKNASQYSDNSWHDNVIDNFQIAHHLAIFPIVVREYTTGLDAITKNDLGWFGHYPNPATNVMNVRLALKNSSDVTITVMSIDGRVLSSTKSTLGAGEHIVPIATDKLPAGTYTYLVRSGNKDGIASQFTVVR